MIIEFITELEGPNGLPEWLRYALSWFIQSERDKKIGIVGFPKEERQFKKWIALGEVLMEELIFSHEYVMAAIEGSFPVDIIDAWIAHLRGIAHAEGAESCFEYVGYTLEGPKIPSAKSHNIGWASITSTGVAPFKPDIFSLIPPHVPIGCDILFASPQPGEMKGLVRRFAHSPGIEFIYKHMGSWISPLEDFSAYYLGILEGEQGWSRVFNIDWLEEQMQKKIARANG